MDVEEAEAEELEADPELSIINEKEVEAMVGVQETESEEDEEPAKIESKSPRIWPDVDTERAMRHYREVTEVQRSFEDEVDVFDTTMVSEYAEDIFKYMSELEVIHRWCYSSSTR